MNDLLQTMGQAGGQWAVSTDNLDGPEEASPGGQRMKELGSMAYSTTAINYATLSLPAGPRTKQKLKNKGRPGLPTSTDSTCTAGERGVLMQTKLHRQKIMLARHTV